MTKFRSLFGAQDMTIGKPTSCLLKFSIPLLIGNFAQLLYSTVDSVVVGRYVGDVALSAIGVSGPITNLFMIFFMAIGTGVTIMVAQYFGARDYQMLSGAIGNSITMIACATVFIMAVATPLVPWMLRVTKTPSESFGMAQAYMTIIFLGAAGNGFYNIISGVLRGLGESIFPLFVLLGSAALNIVLDIWFVAGFKMGVAGAAWATIICQLLSSVVCLIKLFNMKGIVNIKWQHLKPRKPIVMKIVALGVPTGIQQGIVSLSFTFVQSIINGMGYLVTACCTAVMRVDGFAILPCMTFNMASSTFTGQNVGAGRWDRVDKGAKSVVTMSLGVSVVLVALLLIFGKSMISLFTETQAVIDMGARFLRIAAFGYLIMSLMQSLGGVIRGAGDTMAPMWISIISTVCIRVPLAYIWAKSTVTGALPGGNPDIIYWSMVIAWTCGSLMTVWWYKRGKWRNKAIISRPAPAESGSGGE